MDLFPFQESHGLKIVGPGKSKEGKDWEVVIIQPGLSRNRNFYPADVLRKAVPLFENCSAFAYRYGGPLGDRFNHLPDDAALAHPGGFAENKVGWFEKVRYGTFIDREGNKGEGILGRFHILEGHEWLRKNLRDAWNHGKTDILGFSIDAKGRARETKINGETVKLVEKIEEVRSTDIVTEPAAGGQVLRLVAGLSGSDGMKAVYRLIEKHRPMWLEGFPVKEDEEELRDSLLHAVEATLVQADNYFRDEIDPLDDVHLHEVARGVKSLNTLIQMIREGKMDQALAVLRDWIPVYPVPENGDERSRRRGFYSFPLAEQSGSAGGEKERMAASALKETTMDPEAQAKIDELQKELDERKESEEKRDAEIAQREAEVAKDKRDLRIVERLTASELPEAARDRVRELLIAREGEVSDDEIDAAVTKEREYMDKLKETQSADAADVDVSGPLGDAHDDEDRVSVKVGEEKRDRYMKAWDGFFEGGQDMGGVPAFRSLHEAWGEMSGKWMSPEDMTDSIFAAIKMGFPSRHRINGMERHVRRLKEGLSSIPMTSEFKESIGTGDFPITFGDSMFKRLQKEFADPELNDWRKIISSIENLTDATNDFNLIQIGNTGVMPTVPQKGPYQEVTPEPTESNEKLTPVKKGFLFKLTWEDVLADNVGLLRRIPRLLGRSAARTIQQIVWDEIESNRVLDRDGVALIDATHNNIIAGNPSLSFADVITAIKQLRNQTEQDSLEKLGLNPAFLLVSPTNEAEAFEITGSSVKVTTGEDATVANFVRKLGIEAFPTIGLGLNVISATSEFRWYVAANPKDVETIAVGFLGGRDRPDLFVQSPIDTPVAGAAFDSDELTFKQRLVVGAKVADFRWLQGSLATS